MAGKSSSFWYITKISIIGFLLCVVFIILLAKLVDSVVFGYPNISTEQTIENTQPVGKVFYRP